MDLTMNTEETIALDEAVRCLIAQQQAMQQIIASQETNLEVFQHTITEQNQVINLLTEKLNVLDPTVGSSQNFTTGLNSSQRHLPDFKMPSVKLLELSGIFKGKATHELQNSLGDYLACSLEICQLYNFARIIDTTTHTGQPTYVQFVSSGLTGCAHIAWRQLTDEATWDFYKQWIQRTFGSTLTLSQAVEAMEDLHQTGAATQYSATFNELVSAISVAGVTYPEQHLCVKYLNGLKSHLQTMPDLYWIHNDLRKLQQEAETIDDLHFCCNCKPQAKIQSTKYQNTSNTNQFQTQHLSDTFSQLSNPMEIDTVQQQQQLFQCLTPEQKQFFCSKGWCVYCQSKQHDTDHCDKLKAHQ
ncbi:hypothetical protein HK100_008725, partial [Physocladia obscura]